ncbi:flagellin [Pseudorhizobium flavum]|uniref:Flagellin n=1 Tax=Pseudorhizobium flavum TaxID=1335061 RepID=A0A7X0DEY0_9HYPH|nr:flagellin [Pseudorhizobium flavum]MBB6181566.1 flagellin [Pseudorhizobium flavum]CAD6616598.1 flagellin [Pseudorhizobium flavum]
MTSIHTNVGAISALQTLRSISSQMGETQRQVSSGLRVGTASDNSAYWSIATTMRSDNMAISAVEDALGLGAAKVDAAYAGTAAIVDVLKEFKARLVAASEEGIDATKIQAELEQLNEQAESIASSSSFNGVNWLKTAATDNLAAVSRLTSSVTSSFTRSDAGVKVGKIDVDLRKTSMLNVGGGGILQKEIGVGDPPFGDILEDTFKHEGHETHTFYGPVTFGPADQVNFTLILDRSPVSLGETYSITIDKAVVDNALGTSDGVVIDAIAVRKVLQKAFDLSGAKASANRTNSTNTTWYDVQTLDGYGHIASSIYFENLASTLTGSERFLGLDSASDPDHDNMEATATVTFIKPFSIGAGSALSFDLKIDGAPTTTFSIDRNTVSTVLGNDRGRVQTAEEFADLFRAATSGFGLAVNVNGSTLKFSADQAIYPGYGNGAVDFYIGNILGEVVTGFDFDLAEIDVTNSEIPVDEYIAGVERMLTKAISSASGLGSLQMRIGLQASFADTLRQRFDSGIGRLVDADMNEASTRLKALQTQEQLATQSLSIANANAENILTLFR